MASGPLVDCLRLVSADTLYEELNTNFEFFPLQFVPWIDGDLVKQPPKQLFDSEPNGPSSKGLAFFSTLDFLTGICADEGASVIGPFTGVMDPEHFEPNRTFFEDHLVPKALSHTLGEDIPQVVRDVMSHEYSDWDDPYNVAKLRKGLMQIYSDFMFNIPMCDALGYHNSVVKEPRRSYHYRFAIKPSRGIAHSPSWHRDATHADELSYLFYGEIDGLLQNMPYNDDYAPEPWESDIADYMITMWSNFAKTG